MRASSSSGGVFDLARLRARQEELDTELARPDIWENRERAQQLAQEKTGIERELELFDGLEGEIEDVETLLELAAEEDDASTRLEAAEKLAHLDDTLGDAELRQLLGGQYDRSNAILSINSGAGGNGRVRLGRDALAHVSALGRAPRIQDRNSRRAGG